VNKFLLLYIVVIGVFFIFWTSRGNRRRQSQASQLQAALVVGAQVRTIGGLIGEVVDVTDEHVVVETTPGVRLKFVKSAISGVIAPADPEDPEPDDADDEPTEQAAEGAVGDEAVDEAADHAPNAPLDAADEPSAQPVKR
jgi:preprotein translocase subunit YajC